MCSYKFFRNVPSDPRTHVSVRQPRSGVCKIGVYKVVKKCVHLLGACVNADRSVIYFSGAAPPAAKEQHYNN